MAETYPQAAADPVQGGHLVIGGQAGSQNALAGFGMRHALRSDALAARRIIEGVDHTMLGLRELLPSLKAGIAVRIR